MITKSMRTARRITRKAFKFLHPYKLLPISDARYTLFDINELDSKYRVMHANHRRSHEGLIREMQDAHFNRVLEVACGTGWNIPYFDQIEAEYYGLDISETAIAAAMLKYPEKIYFNLGICDCRMIRDDFFDAVYCSSMLEHIGYYEEAITEMLRLAKKEVRILFFEGLSNDDDNQITFHPYMESEVNGVSKDIFGRKVVMQNHVYEKRKGWYWNRYSKKRVLALFENKPFRVEILDRTNRPYMGKETMLVISKV